MSDGTTAAPQKTGNGPTDEARVRANLGTGNAKDPLKLLAGMKDASMTIANGAFPPESVLYIKACDRCHFIVDTYCTKIFVEQCSDLRLTVNKKVITSSAEVWNITGDLLLEFNTSCSMQLDLCSGGLVEVKYKKPRHMKQIVWAAVENLKISHEKSGQELVSGLEDVCSQYDDVDKKITQFIVRVIDGQLIQERIIRLDNGYPTTQREADAWTKRQTANEEKMLQSVREMVKAQPSLLNGLKMPTQQKEKKIPRNGPCTCGSGKKYKKCCGK